MTFALPNATKAKIEDVGVLSQKNRPIDANPGLQLSISMKLRNDILTALDPALKPFLFAPKDGAPERRANRKKDNVTEDLEGVEPISDLPALSSAGSHIKSLVWSQQVTGADADIIFATSRIQLSDCTASAFVIHPQDGGTVLLKFKLEAPDASAEVFGKLAMFKSREVELTFVQHEPAQQDIEPPKPNKAARPPKTPAVIDGTVGHPGAAAAAAAGQQGNGPWAFGDKGANNTPNTSVEAQADAATEAFLNAGRSGSEDDVEQRQPVETQAAEAPRRGRRARATTASVE